jgi:hypothetical protein
MASIVGNMIKTRFVNLVMTQFDAIKSALRSNLETLIKTNPNAAKQFLDRWSQLNSVIMEILASAQPAPPPPTAPSRFSLPRPSFLTPKVKSSGGSKRTTRRLRR